MTLTARQREVLQHVALGERNKEIARALGCGERTIDRHLEDVFQRLGVRSRLAAAVKAGVLKGGGHAE